MSLSAKTVEGMNTLFSIVFMVFRDTQTLFASAAWVKFAAVWYFLKLLHKSLGTGPLAKDHE